MRSLAFLACLALAPLALHANEPEHAPAEPAVPHPAASTPSESGAPEAAAAEASSPEPAQPKPVVRADDSLRREGRGLLNLGASLTERGDFGAAEIAYWQILNNRGYAKPEQCDALFGLACMYRKQGVFTKASAVYEKFLKLYPDDPRVPDALLDLGRSQRAMGAYKNAINRFYNVINSTIKLPPESYEHYQLLAKTAQFEIAETHFETGNFVEAAKFFDRLRLLDLAPEDRARAHFKSACALLKGGEAEKAASIFTQFIDQWPQDINVPEARYLLALTLRQLGRAEEALSITLTLLRTEHSTAGVDPKNWAYWQRRTGNQLANDFFQNGDTLSAVAIYDGLTHLSENPSWRLPIIYQMGLCYERLRQSDRANQAYQSIVEAVAQPTGKEPVTGELSDLARMAQWRLGQLDWNGNTDRQLDRFFSVDTQQPAQASSSASPAHDPNADPAEASRSL
jgi:TolA-binding protein